MNSQHENQLHKLNQRLCKEITRKVINNLSFHFANDGYGYSLISSAVEEKIRAEIRGLLPAIHAYSKAQFAIFQNFKNKDDFDLFVSRVAGRVQNRNNQSLSGLDFTGLSKIFFSDLQYIDHFQYQQRIYPSEGSHNSRKNIFKISATENYLGNSQVLRGKSVIHHFSVELAKMGSPEQIDELWKEIKREEYYYTRIELQHPRNLFTACFYGPIGDVTTGSALKYNSSIKKLSKNHSYPYWKLIGPGIFGVNNRALWCLPTEIGKHILDLGFFNSSQKRLLAKSLPLIRKSGAQAHAEEISNIKNENIKNDPIKYLLRETMDVF